MADDSNRYGMESGELRTYLAEQRENGFLSLDQGKRLFALEFVQSGSYVESATKAGISSETGRRWLKDPLVACFINYLNQQKEHYSLIDASFVESQYLGLFAKLIGEEEVDIVDKDGVAIKRKKFHASEAVAALRDMAKISGHYKDDPSMVLNLNTNLSDDQKQILDKLLDGKF